MKPEESVLKRVAGAVAASPLLSRGRALAEKNKADWNLPLSKTDKLLCGSYLILSDYAAGLFPPVFSDQAAVHENEKQYGHALGGVSQEEFQGKEIRKPFWDAHTADKYLNGFVRLFRFLESLGVSPGARLIELGCGSGWTAEFFALAGYDVVATSIAPSDVAPVESRAAAIRAKGVASELTFKLSAMESVDAVVEAGSFDAAYVHEALHHAYDWKAALAAAFRTLKPGGWMVIADEPNVLHTFISYRVGKISRTHEVGMSGPEIVRALREIGYSEVRPISPRFDDRLHAHWIAARK